MKYTHPSVEVQSDPYLNSNQTLNETELAILVRLLMQIEPDDNNKKPYRIDLEGLLSQGSLDINSYFRQLQAITLGLNPKLHTLSQPYDPDDLLSSVNTFSSVGLAPERDFMEIYINPVARPILLHLKKTLART